MPHKRLAAFSAGAGLAAILVLGQLPGLQRQLQASRAEAALSAPHRQLTLSDDNLADALVALELTERIARVGWDHSILSVDLSLREGLREPAALWGDLAELVHFSFSRARNVRQMLVRVYGETGGRRTLLFYGNAGREKWPEEEAAAFTGPVPGGDEAFQRRIGLDASPAGVRWLRNIAN